MKKLLFDLCTTSGVSGDEGKIAEFCAEQLRRYTDDVKIDFNNTVTAVLGTGDKTYLLDAHIDQIGFIVTEINENGFLKLEKCGGIDFRTVLDAPVIVHGKEDLNGIICCMPPHLSDGNEDKAVEPDKVWVDLGLPSETVYEKVSVGDSVSLYSKPKELLNNRISVGALDNRASVCALIETARILSESKPDCKVIIMLTCQEETFATGAKTASFRYDVDECISVDVSFAAQPGIDDQYAGIELGKGPMLCVAPILNRAMFNKMKEVCKAENIEYQLEVVGGRTGTNSDSIAVTKGGVKTMLVSIPEKNMHTQAEIVELSDIENTAKLISAYFQSGGTK